MFRALRFAAGQISHALQHDGVGLLAAHALCCGIVGAWQSTTRRRFTPGSAQLGTGHRDEPACCP